MIKRILVLTSFLLLPLLCAAQEFTMSSDGRIAYEPNDIDARVNHPVRDFNDRLCALVKVTVVGKLEHELILDLGTTMQTIERRDMRDIGEVWFYIPAGARRMTFKCSGYRPIEITDVPAFQPGGVYRITIETDTDGKYITTAVVKSNYLKVKVPEGTFFSIGRTKNYEISSQILQTGDFSMRLDYGEYYYRAENGFYETSEGIITVDGSNDVRTIEMTPAYSYLDVETEPSGASVFIDGEMVGTSPLRLSDRMMKGTVSIRVQKDMYYPSEMEFEISGDMKRHTATLTLSPQFGIVTCRCEDTDAEIWIDNRMVGIGTWTGQLSSHSSHFLEARKKGCLSQSVNFEVVEGASITKEIGAPEPLYGTIEVTSIPSGATVKLDGKIVGVTPFILNNVLAIEHHIELSKEGYELFTSKFTVNHNQKLAQSYTLTKNNLGTAEVYQESSSNAETGTVNGHEWVDLGLSVLWAKCNIGALKSSDKGEYYAWAETSPKSDYMEAGNDLNINEISGNINYDAAAANWGGGWRMPKNEEYEELLNKCDWQWTSVDGHYGCMITGPNGNSIFLPAAGYRNGTSLYGSELRGYYWTSTPDQDSPQEVFCLYFYRGYYRMYLYNRSGGRTIRPVINK